MGAKMRLTNHFLGRTDFLQTGRPEMYLISAKEIAVTPLGLGWGGYEKAFTGSTSKSGENFLKKVQS